MQVAVAGIQLTVSLARQKEIGRDLAPTEPKDRVEQAFSRQQAWQAADADRRRWTEDGTRRLW